MNVCLSFQQFGLGCFEALRRCSDISAMPRLESMKNPISKIEEARPGIEPRPLAPKAKSLTTTSPLLPFQQSPLCFVRYILDTLPQYL